MQKIFSYHQTFQYAKRKGSFFLKSYNRKAEPYCPIRSNKCNQPSHFYILEDLKISQKIDSDCQNCRIGKVYIDQILYRAYCNIIKNKKDLKIQEDKKLWYTKAQFVFNYGEYSIRYGQIQKPLIDIIIQQPKRNNKQIAEETIRKLQKFFQIMIKHNLQHLPDSIAEAFKFINDKYKLKQNIKDICTFIQTNNKQKLNWIMNTKKQNFLWINNIKNIFKIQDRIVAQEKARRYGHIIIKVPVELQGRYWRSNWFFLFGGYQQCMPFSCYQIRHGQFKIIKQQFGYQKGLCFPAYALDYRDNQFYLWIVGGFTIQINKGNKNIKIKEVKTTYRRFKFQQIKNNPWIQKKQVFNSKYKRLNHSAVIINNKMYVIGGYQYIPENEDKLIRQQKFFSTCQIFDLITYKIQQFTIMGSKLTGMSIAIPFNLNPSKSQNQQIILFGGDIHAQNKKIHIFNIKSKSIMESSINVSNQICINDPKNRLINQSLELQDVYIYDRQGIIDKNYARFAYNNKGKHSSIVLCCYQNDQYEIQLY